MTLHITSIERDRSPRRPDHRITCTAILKREKHEALRGCSLVQQSQEERFWHAFETVWFPQEVARG